MNFFPVSLVQKSVPEIWEIFVVESNLKDILLNPRVSFSILSLFFIFHPGVLDVPGAISLPHPMRQERILIYNSFMIT
jgi:hypothetical protein